MATAKLHRIRRRGRRARLAREPRLEVKHGPEIAPGELAAERSDYGQVVLNERLRQALALLNPACLPEALDDAFRRLTRTEGAHSRRVTARSIACSWTESRSSTAGPTDRSQAPKRR